MRSLERTTRRRKHNVSLSENPVDILGSHSALHVRASQAAKLCLPLHIVSVARARKHTHTFEESAPLSPAGRSQMAILQLNVKSKLAAAPPLSASHKEYLSDIQVCMCVFYITTTTTTCVQSNKSCCCCHPKLFRARAGCV